MPEIYCDAVLFDMDGTILDSSVPVLRQWKRWSDEYSLDWAAVEAVLHGRRAIETMQIVAPHLPQPETVDRFLEIEEKDTEGIVAMPGSRELLEALGEGRWAVVTSATTSMARTRMRAAGLPEAPVLIGADAVSIGKPHPEGFLTAAERLGFAPQRCLVVEDSPAGIQAGLTGGMQVLGVLTHYGCERLGAGLCVTDFSSFDVQRTAQGSLTLRF